MIGRSQLFCCSWECGRLGLDGILKIYEIPEEKVGDDTEVFSRFLKEEEVKSLRTPLDD